MSILITLDEKNFRNAELHPQLRPGKYASRS